MKKVSKHQNEELQKRITANGTSTKLNLSGSKVTNQDMEIVANELEINTVREHYFFYY
jgi:hypothetical protein